MSKRASRKASGRMAHQKGGPGSDPLNLTCGRAPVEISMVVLEGLLIQWGLIGFGVGSVSTAACGISESCGRRKLKREVDTFKAENETCRADERAAADPARRVRGPLRVPHAEQPAELRAAARAGAQLRRSLIIVGDPAAATPGLLRSRQVEQLQDHARRDGGRARAAQFLFPSQHGAIDEISAADFGSSPRMRPILVKLIEDQSITTSTVARASRRARARATASQARGLVQLRARRATTAVFRQYGCRRRRSRGRRPAATRRLQTTPAAACSPRPSPLAAAHRHGRADARITGIHRRTTSWARARRATGREIDEIGTRSAG